MISAADILFYIQTLVLAVCIIVCVIAAAEKFRGWSAARLLAMRNVLTALLGITSLAALAVGHWNLAPICLFILLPMLRASLDPNRGKLTDAQREDIAKNMTREDALRLLELSEDEVTQITVEVAYDRLSAIAASRKGGANPFYATRLMAARDFLMK